MPESKHRELRHFSHIKTREDVLLIEPEKRVELVEEALLYLYKVKTKEEREHLLSLIKTVLYTDPAAGSAFQQTAYTVCNRHLVITSVNDVFLNRSEVTLDQIIGKSLYHEGEYEGSEIEKLYSMVMETRLVADALVRYDTRGFHGWFVIVVIPMEEGGIGVLSRFTKNKEEVVGEIDTTSPDAPRFIQMKA